MAQFGIKVLNFTSIIDIPLGTIKSDSQGKFDIAYLPSGEDYTIRVNVPGYDELIYKFNDWPVNTTGNGSWFSFYELPEYSNTTPYNRTIIGPGT